MEPGMRFDNEWTLDGENADGLDRSSLLAAWGCTLRRESTRTAKTETVAAPPAETGERRYDRFEPITVRTAARVLQLQEDGIVSDWEAEFYLHELIDMDRHAGRGAYTSLLRLARRHLGHRVLTRVRSSEELEGSRPFCLDHPACLGLELALLG